MSMVKGATPGLLSTFPKAPASCQRIKTILIPLTQEEFNEEQGEKSFIFQSFHKLMAGVEYLIPKVTGLCPGQPGSGTQGL